MNPLEVKLTDFYKRDDSEEHHTDVYDLDHMVLVDPARKPVEELEDYQRPPSVILRRGQKFSLGVRFQRKYVAKEDVVRIVFSFGSDPSPARGTVAILRPRLAPKDENRERKFPKDDNQWDAQFYYARDEENIIVQVYIPPDVPVGIWRYSVLTKDPELPEEVSEPSYKIYILFNPWSSKDSVYMENENDRNEYILDESGKIWCGTFNNPEGRHWDFGQFDNIALPAAVFFLDKSNLLDAKRGSPIWVTRAISAMVSSVGDSGLLVGRFDGDYEDGISPHAWLNSRAILNEYLKTKGKPVKYGQCWVYSAIIVTICRALGIPCRSTTNYVSAHDIDSPVIGRYLDTSGNSVNVNETYNDSTWSFHAWNEVWMTRPDLPPGYGGWQIIDGTPLSRNDRLSRASGPASMVAIKNRDLGYSYDTSLLFYDVNADTIHFTQDKNTDYGYRRIASKKYRAGRKIVTKNLGPTDMFGIEDLLEVTPFYKNISESLDVNNAIVGGISQISKDLLSAAIKQKEDVIFDLAEVKSVEYGEGVDVELRVRNISKTDRTISYVLSASAVYYTGKFYSLITKIPNRSTVRYGSEKILKMHLRPKDYLENLIDHGVIKLLVYGNVEETGQVWSEEEDYILKAPNMSIAVTPGICNINERFTVTFTFHNPLDTSLTNCSYTIDVPAEESGKTIGFRIVQPNEVVNEVVNEGMNLIASKKGKRRIVITFTSKQIPYITASTIIEVI